jgi:diguanylate cyclase (GGDEF)-like protein
MDLDNFKSVNDVYGHAAGDKVLAAFARHITQSLRPYDKVFRYGGEEFLIVLPETSLEKGANIIERLRQELARLPLDIDSGVPLRVIASFGIVQLDHGIPVEEAVARTDRALYQAKATGRDRSLVWDSSMTPDGAVLPRDSAT